MEAVVCGRATFTSHLDTASKPGVCQHHDHVSSLQPGLPFAVMCSWNKVFSPHLEKLKASLHHPCSPKPRFSERPGLKETACSCVGTREVSGAHPRGSWQSGPKGLDPPPRPRHTPGFKKHPFRSSLQIQDTDNMQKPGLWISKQKTNVFILQRNSVTERRPDDRTGDHRVEAPYEHGQAQAWVTDSPPG